MTGFSALSVNRDEELDRDSQWSGEGKVTGPEWSRMPILTTGMLGLQIIWSVEMSYASPYLVSLGLSKSFMSIVFLAGPLSGLIVQPLIGGLSDSAHSRFGRRRPYIVFGIVISFSAMYLLGFTRGFAGLFTKNGSTANNNLTIGLATLSIYLIDFSINAVQAMDRALLVDILPVSEQERGNAWAGRMFGLGSVVGFFVGNVDLTGIFSFLGSTQLQIICVISSLFLVVTHCITLFNVRERVLLKSNTSIDRTPGVVGIVKNIWSSFFMLPSNIKHVCYIQLFAWIGWFPVLFFTSLYVGGLHKKNSDIPESDTAQGALEAEATRLGSRALLFNALASFIISIIGPFFVSGVRKPRAHGEYSTSRESGWAQKLHEIWHNRSTMDLASLWAVSHGVFAICMLSTFFISTVGAATAILTIAGFSWAITQWAPFALIAEAIHSTAGHYVLSERDDVSDAEETIPLRDRRTTRLSSETPLGNEREPRNIIFEYNDNEEDSTLKTNGNGTPTKHVHFEGDDPQVSDSNRTSHEEESPSAMLPMDFARQSRSDLTLEQGDDINPASRGQDISIQGKSIEDMAGIVLGIHNVFIVIPQFLITGLSSIIFAIMDSDTSLLDSHGRQPVHPGAVPHVSGNNTVEHRSLDILIRRGEEGGVTRSTDSIAVIFRLGGMSAAIACILAIRLSRALKQPQR